MKTGTKRGFGVKKTTAEKTKIENIPKTVPKVPEKDIVEHDSDEGNFIDYV